VALREPNIHTAGFMAVSSHALTHRRSRIANEINCSIVGLPASDQKRQRRNAVSLIGERFDMRGWTRETATAFVIGVGGAVVIMIGPLTPWTIGIGLSGASLVMTATVITTIWMLRQ
jgi:hypothetical protein